MKNKFISTLQFFIGWPVTILAFFFILKFIAPNAPTVFTSLHINVFFLILGILCLLLYFFLRSFFWKKLLSLKGHTLSLKEISFYWGFTEVKRYVPGNIWSILARTHMLSQKDITVKTTLAATVQEAQFIIVASMLLSLFTLNFIVYSLLPSFPYKSIFVIVITIASLILTSLFVCNRYFFKQTTKSNKNSQKPPLLLTHVFPNYSASDNLYLLTIKTTALFFFGLGTYFGISSFILLYPPHITTFIGYFVFSLLVGYASLITPMGLGVREAITTIGLAKFIPLSLAGFAALFARIIFVISELLFLLLAFLWHKTKSPLINKLENFIQRNWQEIVLAVLILIYILYFTTVSFLRYDNFYTGRFDLGNMDQTVWNTIHGRVFQLTDPNGTDIISRLAFHADFILILLAPFYLLWHDPKMLLLIQTIIVSAGALFVFLISKQLIKNRTIALIFAFSYLINPGIDFANLYDFHGVTLATTFLLGAWYFLQKKNYVWLIIFLFLAGITKEEVWIITAFFGFFLMMHKNSSLRIPLVNQWIGASILLLSVGLFYYLVMYAIPQARGGNHFALSYYSDFGTTPTGIIKSIFLSPQKTLATILLPNRLFYLFKLFFPLGFLSLFAPFLLIFAVPELVINLLSNNRQFQAIYFHYTATITPFLFIAAIYGFKYMQKRFSNIPRILYTIYLILNTLLAAYFFGPLPGAHHPNLDMVIVPQPNASIITNFLNGIPKRFSVAATNNLGSHLSHRQKIFTFPVGIDKADIIFFLLDDQYAQPSLAAQKAMVEQMKRNKNYFEVFKQDDFIVFEKRNLYVQKEPDITHVKLFPLSIPTMQHRDFVGGNITVEKKVDENKLFTTYFISYPSDGLKLYALLGIPTQKVPANGFPVIIVNHGYVDSYDTEKSYKPIVEYFASQGYLVIKPDYRGNGKSEKDNSPLAPLAYTVDVLNLISSLNTLPQANPNNIFLWGHGFGGGVTLKVLEVAGENPQFHNKIKAAAVWAPVTDPYRWYVQTKSLFPNRKTLFQGVIRILGTPQKNPILWQSISQLPYVDDIYIPLEIDQGTADILISYQSSIELYDDLLSFNKVARLYLYPGDDHYLSRFGKGAIRRDAQFFRRFLVL